MRLAKKHLQQCRDSKDKAGEMAALRGLIKGSLAKGDAWNAKRVAAEAVQMAKDAKDKAATAAFLVLLAKAHVVESKTDKAVTVAKEAVDAYKALGNKLGEGCASDALAAAYLAEGSCDAAYEAATTALEIFKAADEMTGAGMVMYTMAQINQAEHKMFRAMTIYEELIEIYTALPDLSALATVQFAAAEIALRQKDFQRAVDFASSAEDRFQEVKDRSRRAKAVMVIASAFSQAEQYNDAANAAQVAVTIYADMHDKAGQATALELAGTSLGNARNPKDARKALEEACFLWRTLKDKKKEMAASVALCKYTAADPEMRADGKHLEANKRALKKTISMAQEIGESRSPEAARAMLELAQHYIIAEKKDDEGVRVAEEAIEIFKELGDLGGQVDAMLLIGHTLLKANQKPEAIELSLKARNIAEDEDDPMVMKRAIEFTKKVGKHRELKSGKGQGADVLRDIKIFNRDSDYIWCNFDAFEGRRMTFANKAGKSSSSGEDAALAKLSNFEVAAPKQQVLYTIKWTKMPRMGSN